MATLRLNLFGHPSLQWAEGGPYIPPLAAKSVALLAYLALEPGQHSREELAGLLWGESTDAKARSSLRQALRQLRTQLGDILRCERAVVQLNLSLDSDVQEFRRLLREEPHRVASTGLPRVFSGFTVPNAPRFEEWVAELRDTLLSEYQKALSALAREAMGQWRWRDAAALAEQWVASDPLSDEAVRVAIEARYLAGDRAAALATFARYRTALQRETGSQPSHALHRLVQRVEADPAADVSTEVTDEWYTSGPSFETDLTGRESEWEQLREAWHGVSRGIGRNVVIEGDRGVGKSRLGEEFVRRIVAEGGIALRGHGYDARAGIPFETGVEVLRGALQAPGLAGTAPEWLAEVVRLLPELRQRFPGLPDPVIGAEPGEQWRFFEGAAQMLLTIAAERPAVVLLEDLQWCDADSSSLLRFLIRRTAQAPVLWLATVTPGELDLQAPAAGLYRKLRAPPQGAVLSLQPLSEEALWHMVRQMGQVSAPAGARRFVHRLFGVTRGNPFYTIELLKTMFAQGLLAVDPETRAWTAEADPKGDRREFTISPSVHEVIAERVERLPEPLRDLLATLAVAGSDCSTEVLSRIHGISRMRAAALSDALVRRQFIVDVGGAYRCVHPVIGRVVRNRLTPSAQCEVHRALALTLESLSSGEEKAHFAEIARHADCAGEGGMAYRFALLAAAAARAELAYREALSCLDVALRNAGTESEREDVRRLITSVLEEAGLTEMPQVEKMGGPITKGLESEDFDLPVRT